MFLTYGAATSPAPAICTTFGATTTACNAGYGAAQYAFGQAQAAGVTTSVTWWLDVENDPSWIPGNTPPTPPSSRGPSTASATRGWPMWASTPAP